MAFQPSADSFGIRRLGVKCSWWHPRQANDTVASERSIFSENQIIKVFSCRGEHIRTIFRGLDAHGGRKLRTEIHTRDNYSNPRCVHVCRGLVTVLLCPAIYK